MIRDLAARDVSVMDIVTHITSRGPEEIGEHNPYITKALDKLGAGSFSTILHFMNDLRQYMKFLDCNLLKEVVRSSPNPVLLKEVENYESAVESFCKSTCVASFINSWKRFGDFKKPENFAELEAKLDVNPKEYTLHDLQEKGRELWRLAFKLKPRLIDACSMIFHKIKPGSIQITWLVPRKIVPDLEIVMKNDDCKNFFHRNNFMKVSLDQRVVYSHQGESIN